MFLAETLSVHSDFAMADKSDMQSSTVQEVANETVIGNTQEEGKFALRRKDNRTGENKRANMPSGLAKWKAVRQVGCGASSSQGELAQLQQEFSRVSLIEEENLQRETAALEVDFFDGDGLKLTEEEVDDAHMHVADDEDNESSEGHDLADDDSDFEPGDTS